MEPRDTRPEAAAARARALSRLDPARRLALLGAMISDVRALANAGLRARHPHASDEEIFALFLRRTIPEALVEPVLRRRAERRSTPSS